MIAGCGSSGAANNAKSATTKLAAEKPAQILKASAAALGAAGSMRMQGTMTQLSGPRRRMHFDFDLYRTRAFSMQIATAHGTVRMIVDGNRSYMRADRAFWQATSRNSPLAAMFANRWIVISGASAHSMTSGLGNVEPAHLASCLAKFRGHITVAGSASVGGRPAVLLVSAGDYPGGQHETIAIAASGPPYPLRLTASGKQRPGGHRGPCGSSTGPASVGSVTLSDFGKLGKLSVPAHALDMNSLQQQSTTTSAA